MANKALYDDVLKGFLYYNDDRDIDARFIPTFD